MVYAQISCKSFELHDHDQAGGNAYLARQTLSARYPGDVFAAVCCFGICGTNGTNNSIAPAIAEIPEIANVQRKVIHNCSIVYDRDRSAELYDPDGAPEVVAHITEDGVVTTKWTAGGSMFMDTDSAGPTSAQRLNDSAARVRSTYCQPQDQEPVAGQPANADGVGNRRPFVLDQTVAPVYVVDQGHVSVPVLVYNGQVCIDYTTGSIMEGMKTVNFNGVYTDVTTRSLHHVNGVTELLNSGPYSRAAGGNNTNPLYVRRIRSLNEPLSNGPALIPSAKFISDWFNYNYAGQVRRLGYDTVTGGAALFANAVNNLPAGAIDALLPTVDGQTSTAVLGGPLPLMIVAEGRLAGTVRVAPLNMAGGLTHVARVQHNGAVDTDMLAARMSRTGGRNVIGVAMQKIAPNAQGDIMLHDGV